MRKLLLFFFASIITLVINAQVNINDTLSYILNSNHPDSIKIDNLNQAIFSYSSYQPESLLVFADSAIQLSTKINDSLRLAHSYSRKGVVLYYFGDYNGALECYFQSIALKEKIRKTETTWREYNNIGLVLRNLELNEEALKYFKLALESNQRSGNKSFEAIAWNNMGISHRGLKQYDQAREAIEKSLAINTEIGNQQQIANNYNNLGNIYYYQKDYKNALNIFTNALKINRSLKNRYEEVQVLNNFALTYLSLNDLKQAYYYLSEAEKILSTINALQLKLTNLDIFATYYTRVSNYKKAFEYESSYSTLRDSLFLANRIHQFAMLKTLADAEKEIQKVEFLKKINNIQDDQIRFQKTIQIIALIVFVLILTLLFVVLRNLRINKTLNKSLTERSTQIEALNEELKSSNELLNIQRNNLEQTLINLQDTQNKLIQSEKMASIGVLASGIAHEINNPLNFISGGVLAVEQHLKESSKEIDEDLLKYLGMIHVGVNRATSIITGLSHYTRSDESKSTDCEIHSIIDSCLLMLNKTISDRIEVVKEYCSYKVDFKCNKGKIHQLFINILLNATQSIDNNGTISIKTEKKNNFIQVTITDSGCGISPENLLKITDPFFTTKDPGIGTGLGLSIAQNIVEEHKGSIDFSSQLGKGTTVFINLPLQ